MTPRALDSILAIEEGIESLILRVETIPEKTGMVKFRKRKAMENLRLAKKACESLAGKASHR